MIENSKIIGVTVVDNGTIYMRNSTFYNMMLWDNSKFVGSKVYMGNINLYQNSVLNATQSKNCTWFSTFYAFDQSQVYFNSVVMYKVRMFGNSTLLATNITEGKGIIDLAMYGNSSAILSSSPGGNYSIFGSVEASDNSKISIDECRIETFSIDTTSKTTISNSAITESYLSTDINLEVINANMSKLILQTDRYHTDLGNITFKNVNVIHGDTMYIINKYMEINATSPPAEYSTLSNGEYQRLYEENWLVYGESNAILNIYNVNLSYAVLRINTDNVAPSIVSSTNKFEFEKGMTSQNISWLVSDVHPWKLEIYINSTLNRTIDWHPDQQTLNYSIQLDNLQIGNYIFTLKAYDLMKNIKESSIQVIVSPSEPPVFTSTPSDTTLEYGANGILLNWTAYDVSPWQYNIYLNGSTYIAGQPWQNNEIISFQTTSLGVGTHNITVEVLDKMGNKAVDSVVVVIEPSQPPQILQHPDSIIETKVDSNVTLRWMAQDRSPDRYVIKINGTTVKEGDWQNNQDVIYTFNNIQKGTHNITITFYDEAGNTATNQVLIHATQIKIGGGFPISPMLITVFAIILVGIIFLIIVIIKKKRA